jgi:integrase
MKKSTHWRTLNNLRTPIRYSIPDVLGLHLWVRSDAKKYWIFRFSFSGRRYDMSLGSFPAVKLSDAKARALRLRGDIFNGKNPADLRKEERSQKNSAKKRLSFNKFASNYIERMSPKWTTHKNEADWQSTIDRFANPVIGHIDLEEITTNHIIKVLTPIWTSKHVTAARLRARLEKIFSAAITTGFRSSINPARWHGHLENLLPNIRKNSIHLKALPYQDVPDFFSSLDRIDTLTSLTLRFVILNACRVGEAIQADVSQITNDVWTIPAERMKARREHQIPLTHESLKLINLARVMSADSPRIFTHQNKKVTALSILSLVRKLRPTITTHGFRSAFRDWVSEETNHSSEVAEMALAHAIHNKVEAAYRRGNLLERRRKLMLDWANFCLSKQHEQTSNGS